MSRFTPYACKYIGYLIAKGKLNLDLHYYIDGNILKASNRAFLDQFTLGEDVESKTSTSLPVKFAISLLTDRNGRIKLNIPVEGDISDPDFSIAGTVFQIIRNLIMKAATSPFSLIASAFGGGEELQYTDFEPGSADLSEAALKKLRILADAVNEHPEIKVELMGGFDPESDRKTIEKNRFNSYIKQAKYNDLSRKERASMTPEEVAIKPDEYEKYLKAAWKKAPFKKEKNFIGLVKSQPVPVMEKMLRDYCVVSDGELRTLALERTEKCENYLVSTCQVDATRLFMVEPGTGKREPGAPATAVEVNIR